MVKNIYVNDIRVGYRIRKENDNFVDLAESIRKLGLINPITVMQEEDGRYLLIAGFRRLQAMRVLCRKKIAANVLSAMDSERQLLTEIEENEQRKDFTCAEKLEYAERLKVIEKQKAKERMSAGGRGGFAKAGITPQERGRVGDIVARKAGFGNRTQMRRAKYIADNKPELLALIDAGKKSLYGAYKEAANLPGAYDTYSGTKVGRNRVKLGKVEPFEAYEPFVPDDLERKLKDHYYAELYANYKESVYYGNRVYSEAICRCEEYERQIRDLKENLQYCRRLIDIMEGERCAKETSSENL